MAAKILIVDFLRPTIFWRPNGLNSARRPVFLSGLPVRGSRGLCPTRQNSNHVLAKVVITVHWPAGAA